MSVLQVRKGVFETNSSSTHSIAISYFDKSKLNIPKHLNFQRGEYGWEFETYSDVDAKASYLYEAILSTETPQNYIDTLTRILKNNGCEAEFNNADYGYIDHSHSLYKWLVNIFENEELILSYLFDDDSFVETGNDNSDYECFSEVYDAKDALKYKYIYMKGN